ncbi:uncharacterized protein LOC134723255 [Mytilus trossulus]|uniref:uncharacterized protein LOC134723255 n=1 Tax=Mytilus trossulus TaxID=6551 RepID=UPI003005E88C
MYFLMSYCIVVIFYIQMVSSQVELKRESAPPFFCVSSLKLICKYSGLAACCSADTRVWRLNNTQIMNNGVESSTTGKYTETIDVAQKLFELTISNIGASDFGINYVCEYGFDASTPLKLKIDHLICGKCPSCGWRCFGWGCLATFWANYSMMVGIFILIWRDHEDSEDETTNSKDSCCKRVLHDGYFIAFISTLLSAAIAIPIGLYFCICYDFGDDAYLYYPDPSFISVGYFVVISTLLMMKCFKCRDLNCKDVCILIGIVITCPFGPILYSAYIFKYEMMKTWKDIDFKDILLLLSGVFTYGIAVFLLCKDWPTEEENNPKKKTQANSTKKKKKDSKPGDAGIEML